jgi:hypothetical protein
MRLNAWSVSDSFVQRRDKNFLAEFCALFYVFMTISVEQGKNNFIL